MPNVPPVPIFKVEVSVPAKVRVLDNVNVFEVVPPAMVKPVVAAVKVKPFTVPGVMFPSPMVRAGVLVAVAQVAVTPLLAAAVETEVTVPVPLRAMFPFNLLIAWRIESVAATVPAPLTYPVSNFPVTPASVKEAVGKALSASVP